MKTKLSALILIAALLSQTLVSCGSTDDGSETTDTDATSTSNETTAETTEETTETTAPAADVSVTELADAVKGSAWRRVSARYGYRRGSA